MDNRGSMIELDEYHIPRVCTECGGVMIFKGVGEYQCEDCKAVAYDDYGKVRRYIETHRGATAYEAEEATGVKQRTIRTMLKEGRLAVTEDSKAFLQCELCGESIRFGRFCKKCEIKVHRQLEDDQRKLRSKGVQGVGMSNTGETSGLKRFRMDDR